MSLPFKFFNLLDVLLRVPPVLLIDDILRSGLGLTEITEHDLSVDKRDFITIYNDLSFNFSTSAETDPTFYRYILVSLARFLLCSTG